jgi:hypothetical protein
VVSARPSLTSTFTAGPVGWFTVQPWLSGFLAVRSGRPLLMLPRFTVRPRSIVALLLTGWVIQRASGPS